MLAGHRLVPDHEQQEVGVLPPHRVPVEVHLAPLVVRDLLVDDPAPLAVHDDHAVAEGLVDVLDRLGHPDRELGHHLVPPGVAHVAELGAHLDADVDEVPGAALRGRAAEHRPPEVLERQAPVVEEPARGEHDAPAGAEQLGAPPDLDLEADDLQVLVADEVRRRGARAGPWRRRAPRRPAAGRPGTARRWGRPRGAIRQGGEAAGSGRSVWCPRAARRRSRGSRATRARARPRPAAPRWRRSRCRRSASRSACLSAGRPSVACSGL